MNVIVIAASFFNSLHIDMATNHHFILVKYKMFKPHKLSHKKGRW